MIFQLCFSVVSDSGDSVGVRTSLRPELFEAFDSVAFTTCDGLSLLLINLTAHLNEILLLG